MRSKIIIITFSLFLLGCGCPGPGHKKPGIYHVDIKSYDTTRMYDVYAVQNEYTGEPYLQNVQITSNRIMNVDTLAIHFVFNATGEKIASATNFSFISTAYACSPVFDAFTLKYKIDSVLITSDTTYNGIEKGKSLNALFSQTNFRGGVEELVTELNSEGALNGSYYFNFMVATDKKSGIYTEQELFIKIFKSNGEIMEGSTGKFKWY